MVAAIYYTAVGFEKSNREQTTDRQRTEKAITEATLIVDGSSGWEAQQPDTLLVNIGSYLPHTSEDKWEEPESDF